MSFKKISLFFILCSSLLSIAQASTSYNSYQGQYLSINAGATYANKIYQPGVTKSGILGAGGNLFLGTTYNQYIAAEISGQYFSFGSWGGVTIASFNVRFTAPVGSHISLYARVGAGFSELTTRLYGANGGDVISNGGVPVFGVGIGYGLTQLWMLSLEANGAYFSGAAGNNGHGMIGGITIGGTRYFNV